MYHLFLPERRIPREAFWDPFWCLEKGAGWLSSSSLWSLVGVADEPNATLKPPENRKKSARVRMPGRILKDSPVARSFSNFEATLRFSRSYQEIFCPAMEVLSSGGSPTDTVRLARRWPPLPRRCWVSVKSLARSDKLDLPSLEWQGIINSSSRRSHFFFLFSLLTTL